MPIELIRKLGVRQIRAYNAGSDFQLGDYGVDTGNDDVWAVVNGDGQFAVGDILPTPQPGSAMLLAVGAALLLGWRRRRGVQSSPSCHLTHGATSASHSDLGMSPPKDAFSSSAAACMRPSHSAGDNQSNTPTSKLTKPKSAYATPVNKHSNPMNIISHPRPFTLALGAPRSLLLAADTCRRPCIFALVALWLTCTAPLQAQITDLANFNGSNGSAPQGGVTQIGSTLYGSTDEGGANGYGAVFSVPVPTPEPGSAMLLAVGAAMFLGWRRRTA